MWDSLFSTAYTNHKAKKEKGKTPFIKKTPLEFLKQQKNPIGYLRSIDQ